MSGEIFSAGVHDQIDAEIRWALINGCGKSAVDKSNEIVLFGQRSYFAQVNHAQYGIRRRLQIKQLRIRSNRACVLIVFSGIHKGSLDAQLGQPLTQEFCSAAVNVALGDYVVSSFQQRQDRSRNRSHAGSKQ